MRTFKDCTHYFFYSDKQYLNIWNPTPWQSSSKELPTFKGKVFTETIEIGTGWSGWDDAVYLGAGTYADAVRPYIPGNRSQNEPRTRIDDVLNRLVNTGEIPLHRLVGAGFPAFPQFKSDKQIVSERMEELVKLVNYDRAKKITDQLVSVLKVCYDSLCMYGSHPIIGAYVNKVLKEYNDDKSV